MHTTLPNTDRSNLAQEGITKNCALAFSKTAEDNNCIVMTRTPGKACLQLLEEGYDAKGFHVKAKSCNWGPMSGFICVHPLFNKKGFCFSAKASAGGPFPQLTPKLSGAALRSCRKWVLHMRPCTL